MGLVVLVCQVAKRIAKNRVRHRDVDDLPLDDPALVAGQVEHHLVVVATVAAAKNGAAGSRDVVSETDARRDVVDIAVPLTRFRRVFTILVRGTRLEVVTEAEVERETWRDGPVVLEIRGVDGIADLVRRVAQRNRGGVGEFEFSRLSMRENPARTSYSRRGVATHVSPIESSMLSDGRE